MTYVFRSSSIDPEQRGIEFGKIHSDRIRENIGLYQNLFAANGGSSEQVLEAGKTALTATQSFAPALHSEMLGLAKGAQVEPALIGMLNARTEILALVRAKTRGECSTVIHVPTNNNPPIAIQTWDWFLALRQSWLVWEIPLADGSITKTMTEYGIVGKSGMNSRGLGVLFTILHHANDGKSIGVPVHVVSRHLLDSAPSISRAAQLAANAKVSASSSLNLVSYADGISAAITVELYPEGPGFVLPSANGFLIHTNHFLAAEAQPFDSEPKSFPDTLLRYDHLARHTAALQDANARSVLKIMANHIGGTESVCCHHDSTANADAQYETLSTVVIDFANSNLNVHAGGPCSHPWVS